MYILKIYLEIPKIKLEWNECNIEVYNNNNNNNNNSLFTGQKISNYIMLFYLSV